MAFRGTESRAGVGFTRCWRGGICAGGLRGCLGFWGMGSHPECVLWGGVGPVVLGS